MFVNKHLKCGRLQAVLLHFSLSSVVAIFAALLIFSIWYPYPYGEISGGKFLLYILILVDICIGPLCTFFIFNIKKSSKELLFDFLVVGLVQLVALGYGLWAVYQARPLHMVFEYRLFRVVHANEVPDSFLKKVPENLVGAFFQQPTILSLRPFRDAREQLSSTSLALEGINLSAQPELWQPYELARSQVLAEAKPLATLKSKFPKAAQEIDDLIHSLHHRNERRLAYLPLVSRGTVFWTVVVDTSTARIIGVLPLDSF